METVKRLFISLLVLLGCTAGAWAIEQDSDGYYLIGSVQDWKDFAELVNTGTVPAANAKMVCDVDLGDDQTMVGSESVPYQGTFDGHGYKLTIAYDVTENYVAPFRVVNGATIQNLEVAGTINTTAEYAGGIIGYSPSSSTASNVTMCRSSVNIVGHSTISGRTDWHGGFIGLVYTPVHFTDCLSDGKITGSSSPAQSFCTGFIGLTRGGTSTFTNCLNNCELDVNATNGLWHFIGGTGSVRNSYVNNTISYTAGYSQATSVTGEQLSDGTVTAMLQNNRGEEIWVQDPVLGIPMLKIFATFQDEDGYYLIGSVQDWKRFADIVNSGTNTAANAKMIADVDLGDDQTYISPNWHGEFSNLHYHGTFDGQGHTLTVHYNSDKYFHTPFSQTSGATIKNLHVAGTIISTSSGPSHMSGLISNSAGNDVIQNVWVSTDITGGSNSWIECGAFIGCNNCGNSTITDCLFTGSITTTGGNNGCFAGWVQSYNPSSITTTNCLSTGTFNIGSGSVSRGTLNNCYVKSYPYSIPSAMQVTDEQLADGTIATKLQADRSEEIWVQDPVLGIPMLKIFAKTEEDNPVTDLSATTTANTYIVSAAGKYKFNATVKGNGGLDPLTGTIATPIDPASIAGVKVLWELGDTYGRAIKYEDSAYDISYSDG